MNQLRSFRDWLGRHRRAVIISAAAITSACYVARHYYLASLAAEEEARHRVRMQEQAEAERQAELQLHAHFEAIQNVADTKTLPSVLPLLKERLFASLELASLTNALMVAREGGGDKQLPARHKMALWQELKIKSFTRTLASLWSVALLQLSLRTQLNILSRHAYTDALAAVTSGVAGASLNSPSASPSDMFASFADAMQAGSKDGLSQRSQYAFLLFSDYLPIHGLRPLVANMQQAVASVVGSISLREPIGLPSLRSILARTRSEFDALTRAHPQGWARYLLPERDDFPPDDVFRPLPAGGEGEEMSGSSSRGGLAGGASSPPPSASSALLEALPSRAPIVLEAEDRPKVAALVAETRRVLGSTEFVDTLGACIDACLDLLLASMQTVTSASFASEMATHGSVPLAKFVPLIAGMASDLMAPPPHNTYLVKLQGLPMLDSLCSLVYSSPPAQ